MIRMLVQDRSINRTRLIKVARLVMLQSGLQVLGDID